MILISGNPRPRKRPSPLGWVTVFALWPVTLDDTGDWIWLERYERRRYWTKSTLTRDSVIHSLHRKRGSSWDLDRTNHWRFPAVSTNM